MRQILQNLTDGSTLVAEVPRPLLAPGHVLVRTRRSLVSPGTERMLLEFGSAGWIDRARQQPDKVRMVLEKARTDGIFATVDAVKSKLDQPLPLGYCNVGEVVEVAAGVDGLSVGDRVVSNGHHAEFVCVPKNLTAKIPEGVSDEDASFTVLAAIGLQGIRLAQPTLGETFAVMGLGLIGLLTVQMLRAHGCRVIGLDFDEERLALAQRFGAKTINLTNEEPVASALALNQGRAIDGVLVTASTQKSEPIAHAAKMCRKRGRIILVGVTGLELSRADFFEKELTFQVSCSYGPGRYDAEYERDGHDYPLGFVRWTEQRNFEAVLGLLADQQIDTSALATHRFALSDAPQAYGVLTNERSSLGIILEYPETSEPSQSVQLTAPQLEQAQTSLKGGAHTVSFIGAGNYASRTLIPAFRGAGARLATLVSARGVTASHHGSKHGFLRASTDVDSALSEPNVDAVVIATPHHQHAEQVLAALCAGKHVFCEKPLCLDIEELDEISAEMSKRPEQLLMVGFNRRFAPTVTKARSLLKGISGPLAMIATVNAGEIPREHWTQDRKVGGGRIIGEACHFIDLLRYLAGSRIVSAHAEAVGGIEGGPPDNASVTLRFENGSVGTIHYLSKGNKSFPKERIEVFGGGTVLQIDNFRQVRVWGHKELPALSLLRQDKGNVACAGQFVEAIRNGGAPPIPLDEILEVSRWTIQVAQSLEKGDGEDP